MCGRFAQNDETNRLIEEYVAAGGRPENWVKDFHRAWDEGKDSPLELSVDTPDAGPLSGVDMRLAGLRANYNLAPSQRAVIVRDRAVDDDHFRRQFERAQWGFWPSYIEPGEKRPRPTNARVETVAKGMFRKSLLERRCIVPMLGYYEWEKRTEAGKEVKQPHFLHPAVGGYLSAAGLWTVRPGTDDEWLVTFTIITREARDASGEVHDRMPVFLTEQLREEWLDPAKVEDPDGLVDRIKRDSEKMAKTIASYTVSRRVNSSRYPHPDDPTLLDPAEV